jgi:hypothetical protein
MRRAWLLAFLVLSGSELAAQGRKLKAGGQFAFGDYRETTAALQYQGGGAGFWLAFRAGKLSADGSMLFMSYQPVDGTSAVDEFKATQMDAKLRYYLAGGVSAEIGFTRRIADPEFEAQSVSAGRVGLHAGYLLGPGANVSLRGNFLPAAKFSGGGSASFGFEVGLGLSVGASNERWRLTADYEFQRFNRVTNNGTADAKVPLQQSLARIGAAIGF